jgi:hypothetical protein
MDTSTKLDYSEQNRNAKGRWGKWKGAACLVDGCTSKVVCRGYCESHYAKKRWADGHRSAADGAEPRRNARLKHRYGITAAEYDRMFAEQHGVCAICGKPADATQPKHWGRKLAVDHCHDTGKVRGLLCFSCNTGVGLLGTEQLALAAAGYLRLHTG